VSDEVKGFVVYFSNGKAVQIPASKYRFAVDGRGVEFLGEDGKPVEHVFVAASAVVAIVPVQESGSEAEFAAFSW
jgi:hypothetical protein